MASSDIEVVDDKKENENIGIDCDSDCNRCVKMYKMYK